MKTTPLAAIAAFFVAALCAFMPVGASAQTRDNVFAVSGVSVDETAANATEAQLAGFTAAQRQGFDRLVRRLTLPDELSQRGAPNIAGGEIDRMVLSVDVEDERRSGTRYIGRLTVRFDASAVRALLRGQGLTVVDTRTAPVMVAPQVGAGASAETVTLWREVWEQGGYSQELAPLLTAPAGLLSAPDWNAAAPYAQQAGAASALFATLRVQGSTVAADLVEVGPNGARRDRGEVLAAIAGSDAASLRRGLVSLADQASLRLQNDWKARIATGTGQRARMAASALYGNEREWEQIKQALEAAAATLISEIRIEAVGREGASVSFSFVGDQIALAEDLTRRGVTLETTAVGPTLRVRR